jgi:hypothetical protein
MQHGRWSESSMRALIRLIGVAITVDRLAM